MKVCGKSGESEWCIWVCRQSQPTIQISRYSPDLSLERSFERRIGGYEGRYLGNTHFSSPIRTHSAVSLAWRNCSSEHSIDRPAPNKVCTRGTPCVFYHRYHHHPPSFQNPLLFVSPRFSSFYYSLNTMTSLPIRLHCRSLYLGWQ